MRTGARKRRQSFGVGRGNLELPPSRERVGPQCAQAQLEIEASVLHGGRGTVIGVAGKIVKSEHEAIIDVAESNPRLIELVNDQVVARGSEHNPIGRELVGRAGEEAFAAVQKTKVGLRRIVSVKQI